jgi:hypothetical protein
MLLTNVYYLPSDVDSAQLSTMNDTSIRARVLRATQLLQEMEKIEAELQQLFGYGAGNAKTTVAPVAAAVTGRKKRKMSAEGRARIAAAARARWARQKGESGVRFGDGERGKTPEGGTPSNGRRGGGRKGNVGKKKRTMSPEARAKIAAAQKRRWAKQKARK